MPVSGAADHRVGVSPKAGPAAALPRLAHGGQPWAKLSRVMKVNDSRPATVFFAMPCLSPIDGRRAEARPSRVTQGRCRPAEVRYAWTATSATAEVDPRHCQQAGPRCPAVAGEEVPRLSPSRTEMAGGRQRAITAGDGRPAAFALRLRFRRSKFTHGDVTRRRLWSGDLRVELHRIGSRKRHLADGRNVGNNYRLSRLWPPAMP